MAAITTGLTTTGQPAIVLPKAADLEAGIGTVSGVADATEATPSRAICAGTFLDRPHAAQNRSACPNGLPQFGQKFANSSAGTSVSTAAALSHRLAAAEDNNRLSQATERWFYGRPENFLTSATITCDADASVPCQAPDAIFLVAPDSHD